MSAYQPLAPELEAQAQELLARLRDDVEDDLLALARLLVSKEDQQLFGETEFEARQIVHRIGTQAYQARLAEKKTATSAPASTAPPVAKPPSTRITPAKPSSA